MLIDTHCHLDATEYEHLNPAPLAGETLTAFSAALQVAHAAAAAGVGLIIIPAVQAHDFSRVAQLAQWVSENTPVACGYTLGIHPLYTLQATPTDLERLKLAITQALSDPYFLGVGEIGLDLFVRKLPLAQQQRYYEAQLRLAADFSLPVLLHVRRAQDLILKALRRYRVKGIAHAFNGSEQQAQQFIALGFKLGIGGAMTYPRALQIRRLATQLPLESLVLETDAPDIPPAWLGQPSPDPATGIRQSLKSLNTPAELFGIAACLAELRQLSVSELIQQTAQNTYQVLPRVPLLLQSLGRA
ncbi:TatD family hydrolase [Parvibium lacunae]|uniref:TatD family deoxyribonuclease n=1 Tax=Parvibium lacunae TaxID=1888893 RepID=A0A368L7H3_9BURK|nr:TatD family hydrolase [Parvibium lacunae]RCS59648.1 TatD family deoxyribonuclease [Parvibium lacunae]